MPTYRVGFKKKDGTWTYMMDPDHPSTVYETTNVRAAHTRKRQCLEYQGSPSGSTCRHGVVVSPSPVPPSAAPIA